MLNFKFPSTKSAYLIQSSVQYMAIKNEMDQQLVHAYLSQPPTSQIQTHESTDETQE